LINIFIILSNEFGFFRTSETTHSESIQVILSTTNVMLIWFNVFYWARLNSEFLKYVQLVIETLKDIKIFMGMFLIIVCLFANAFFILNAN
jgi:hypothetical protein